MSRVSSEDTKVTKTPRKRAPRRVATKKSDSVVARITESFREESASRKAPTSIPSVSRRTPAYKKPLIILGIFLVTLGVAAGIGFSDTGQVNVADRISANNERLNNQNGGGAEVTNADGTVTVPVQNTPQAQEAVPAYMLIGSGVGTQNIEATPAPEEAATSTDSGAGTDTASSTDSGEVEVEVEAAPAEPVSEAEAEPAASE